MSQQTYTTKFSEETTIGVLGKLKFKNECLNTLHDRVNQNLSLIEELISQDSDNKTLQNLLLCSLQNLRRSKTVFSYTEKDSKTGKDTTVGYAIPITPEDFRVSVTQKGKVRVHITEAKASQLKKQYASYKDFKLYE